ncbi:MAG: acetolactate synthase small subunit [Candidatus Altiarchaeales archaeon]|nr:acetolactate synthase small subunit [Candidatus Altiarchaeales archaeon]MBD3415762.1 acetolactate synthase small subunit [Candidatus Altiarchaeales archaeon]
MSEERVHVFTALVEHKPGVLQRIASLFARRKFNIESITVGATDHPDIARMTIVTRGDDRVLEQINKQMNKLVNVIRVTDISPDNAVMRELCIVKVNTPSEKQKAQVIQYADVFRGNIVDVSPKTLSVEIIGDTNKINAFLSIMRTLGIKEIARTGATAIQRG